MKIEITANKRALKGTGASRRLRHSGKTPGILYGGKDEAKSIELDSKELMMKFKHEAFHASILALNLDGKSEKVLLNILQFIILLFFVYLLAINMSNSYLLKKFIFSFNSRGS